MDQEVLKKYFSSHHKNLVRHLDKISKKNAEEEIHKLRVDIKKIRFLLQLVQAHNPHADHKELYKPYKQIFRHAAKVREAQMKRRILKKYLLPRSMKQIQNLLNKEETKQLKKFIPQTDEFVKTLEDIKPKVSKAIRHAYAFSSSEYAAELVDKICNQFISYLTNDQLHQSRKILKEAVYSINLSPELHKYIVSLFNVQQANKLQESIGVWHDNLLLLQWIFNDDAAIAKISAGEKKILSTKIRKNIDRHTKTIQGLIKKITLPVAENPMAVQHL